MSNIKVNVAVRGKPFTGHIFEQVDACFTRAKYVPDIFCQVHAKDAEKWDDIAWTSRSSAFSEGVSFVMVYRDMLEDDRIRLRLSHYDEDLWMVLETSIAGYCYEYSQKAKARVLRLEALSLDLHKTLEASETEAYNEWAEEPFFRFAEDGWKPVGDLPLEAEE
jgi:hypothetical protein